MSTSNHSGPGGLPRKNALTIAVGAALSGQNAADAQETRDVRGLEEIIVTAQKRQESQESLQDVSFSIQAFSEEDMVRQGLYSFEDYVRFLPSVSFVSEKPGSTEILFRGVVSNPGGTITDSSAALYLDEQPLTQFNVQVDPRLVDIERIEALSGPQGTLYGDSSQSGTLRIITNKPNATKFEAFTDVTGRSGSDSDASYDVSGMVNIPLVEDQFAIRLVGFSARDGGFIDNVAGTSPTLGASTPARGLKTNDSAVGNDFNDVDITGGRIAARWTPDDTWSVTGSAIFQNTEADGSNDYDPGVGELKTVKFFEEPRDDKWWQTALTIEKSFGNFKFLSTTTYFDRKIDYTVDRTEYAAYFNYVFCSAIYAYSTYCWSGLSNGNITLTPGQGVDFTNPDPDDQDTTGFNTFDQDNERITQEFRISQEESRYRWVAGLFYEKKWQEWFYQAYTPEFLSTLANFCWSNDCDPNPSPDYVGYEANEPNPAGEPAWWFSHDDVDWEQWAVFGDFTYDLTDHWIVSVGARYYDAESERVYEVDKVFITAPGAWPDRAPDAGKRKSDDSDILPKISLTYKFDEDRLVYGLFSQGFRAGGVNRNRRPSPNEEYDSDTLSNYELGAKTRWLDDRLQVNATVFYMEWKDFQTELVDPAFGTRTCDNDGDGQFNELCPFQVIVVNAGDAEQKGAELSVRGIVGEGLDVGLDATWLDAELSDGLTLDPSRPEVPSSSPLAMVPDWKYSVFAQYTWPVNFVSGGSMYARLQYSFVDGMLNQLEPFPEVAPGDRPNLPQREMDSYGIADLSVGLNAGQWELQAFVENFTDEQAELYWSTDNHHSFWGRNQLNTNRPREYGLRFLYRWGEE